MQLDTLEIPTWQLFDEKRDRRDVHAMIGGTSTYELRGCLVGLAPDIEEVLVGHGGDLHALGTAGAINGRPQPDH